MSTRCGVEKKNGFDRCSVIGQAGCAVPLAVSGAEGRTFSWTALAVHVLGIFFFALCTAWGAKAGIYLGFTPVPITLQTLPVLMAGAVMGKRWGAASMLLYALLGCAGLPFFTETGPGFKFLLGPTGGYIVGFIAASWIVGSIARTEKFSWKRLVIALSAGSFAIYTFGILGLVVTQGCGLARAISQGALPFVIGDTLKMASAAGLIGITHRWTRRFFPLGAKG